MIPIKKIPNVFKVRQTSPKGHILLIQKSMTPIMYRIERTKVPVHTNVDPYNMK